MQTQQSEGKWGHDKKINVKSISDALLLKVQVLEQDLVLAAGFSYILLNVED